MRKRRPRGRMGLRRRSRAPLIALITIFALALAAGIFFLVNALIPGNEIADETASQTDTATAPPTPTPVPSLSLSLVPAATDKTDPSLFGFETDIMVGSQEVESYDREDPITFGSGDEYTTLPGIITFRGNNYRDMSSYGTATVTSETLSLMLTKNTTRIGSYGGSGWTGQPLVVTWPAELREKMTTLYEQFRTQENFTEVILCSLDGRIYFMDLATGAKTRDFITIGAPTKGTASLDPRGYPIIYVGQGLQSNGDASGWQNMCMRAYSLIDGTKLMEIGYEDADPFAYRYWQAYDSSPLIDAETDTLIWPGENGVLYTFKLNTSYNADAGVVTMAPNPATVKYRYTSTLNTSRETEMNGRWGIEDSAVAWRNYLMFTDNAGVLQCVNLNTMELIYANDLGNDSDVTMILEEIPEEQRVYLYAGCEYDDDVMNVQPGTGPCYAYKIDAMTGEIIWKVPFTADSGNDRVDGGILASPVLGREGTTLEGLVIYNVTQMVSGDSNTSVLVAIDKENGEIVWTYDMGVEGWSSSSPVAVYSDRKDASGKTIAYLVQCEIGGVIALIRVDGAYENGYTEVDKLNVNDEIGETGNNFEATPAVFGNTIVIASRSDHVFFITIN